MKLSVVLLSILSVTSLLRAEESAAKPMVWMKPASLKGEAWRDLFSRPDEWKETRAKVDVLFEADWFIDKQFSDAELRQWLPMIDNWGLKFGLEVGAIKEWGQTGQATFDIQRKKWDRFQSLGGKIYALAIDEPLVCARFRLKKPTEYAVEETAKFIQLVRQNYPQVLIGDIETFPSIPIADHLAWIDALQAKLKQLNVRGLDFYRLDVDWNHFIVYPNRGLSGNWSNVKRLELACRERKIPFSLIYWAASYPALKKLGLADDSTWYTSIMQQGYAYALVGGEPNDYVIESWIEAPSKTLPESDQWTFTRSVVDFSKRFAKP